MTSGSANFAMLLQIKDGSACIVFSLFPKRSIGVVAFTGLSYHPCDYSRKRFLLEHHDLLFVVLTIDI